MSRHTEPTIVPIQDRQRSVALKISVLARQLRLTFDQSAEDSGLTRAQWQLIATVARHPGTTQRTIAEALEVREITAGRLVDRLCEEGYLRRELNPEDRRAWCVYLTSAAQPLLDKLDQLAHLHEIQIFAGLSRDNLDELERLLDRLTHNLAHLRISATPEPHSC